MRLKWISTVHDFNDDKRMQGQMDLARRTHADPRDNARAQPPTAALLFCLENHGERGTKNEEQRLHGERLLVNLT